MNHFIKLSSMVINKLHITQIIQEQGKYRVFLTHQYNKGFMLWGCGTFTIEFGMIEICETKNKQDYSIITEFITHLEIK
jgi:hypothetical protein